VLVRQAVAIGVGVVLIILVVLGVNGCRNSAKQRALKDYNRNVTAIVNDSDSQVGKPFFQLMANGAREGDQLQVQVNQLRLAADEDVKRARRLSVPGGMRHAQDNLLLVLDLRAEGLAKIAAQLPRALGRGAAAATATSHVAGEMQELLASDVVYKVRVAPLIKDALDHEGIHGQTISDSQFLSDAAWLSASTVAERLGQSAGGAGASGAATPGLHGHGLLSVAVGATTLQPQPATNRLPVGNGVTFSVKFANQGDNDERNVRVNIRVRSGTRTIVSQTKTIGQTKARTDAQVDIPLGQTPPAGSAIVDVSITAVPGETKTDNNRQSYTVIFQG
jgi:hypothetical protein